MDEKSTKDREQLGQPGQNQQRTTYSKQRKSKLQQQSNFKKKKKTEKRSIPKLILLKHDHLTSIISLLNAFLEFILSYYLCIFYMQIF